jgi:myosin-6
MDTDGKKFWVSDPENGFILGKLVDIGADSLTIEPFDAPGKVIKP